MDGGSCVRRFWMLALTASATSTVLLPGWRRIDSTMVRTPLYQLPERGFSTPSVTVPRSPRRTGEPLRYVMVMVRNASASFSWPLDWSASALYLPFRTPAGVLTLLALTALTTSSRPILRYARARGSSRICTAYRWAPMMSICATPSMVERRCARIVSAYSLTVDRGRVCDCTAKKRIGESDGLDLLNDGGCIPWGSCRTTREIAV